MTRPAEYTRDLIIKAAVSLFAEKGFERSSVRDIVTKARVNQAAINYHFKGKDGLYFEVLKIAFERLTENAGVDAEELKSLSPERALRRFVRHQLRPLGPAGLVRGVRAEAPIEHDRNSMRLDRRIEVYGGRLAEMDRGQVKGEILDLIFLCGRGREVTVHQRPPVD